MPSSIPPDVVAAVQVGNMDEEEADADDEEEEEEEELVAEDEVVVFDLGGFHY